MKRVMMALFASGLGLALALPATPAWAMGRGRIEGCICGSTGGDEGGSKGDKGGSKGDKGGSKGDKGGSKGDKGGGDRGGKGTKK
jgi:hypothetical protein